MNEEPRAPIHAEVLRAKMDLRDKLGQAPRHILGKVALEINGLNN